MCYTFQNSQSVLICRVIINCTMTVFPCYGSATCTGYFGKQSWVYWTLLSWYEQNSSAIGDNRELKQRRRRRQRERQKSNWFRLAKKQHCTCITLFCTFFFPSLHDYVVKMPKFTYCGGRKHNTTALFFFYWSSLQSWNSTPEKKKCQHLTNWTSRNKGDVVWSSTTSLCKWRFLTRRRRCRLKVMLHGTIRTEDF